jgi:hypothetical protein
MGRAALIAVICGFLSVGCDEPSTPGGADMMMPISPDAGEPPLTSRTFVASTRELLNPERGFYDLVDLTSTTNDYSAVRTRGLTLAYAPVVLDPTSDTIPATLLGTLSNSLGRVRTAGIKLIVRFAYNDCACADAPRARILTHLQQLQPLFAGNADVMAVVQAGLIGQWGEWHDSTNGLDNTDDRRAILTALLAVLPAARMSQIRTPMFKSDLYGGALTADRAFSGTDQARVGHHNDCFLASDTDLGTYATPIDTWKQYVADEGQYTPVGGETCALNPPRTDCASATAEMARLHWSFLNINYRPEVLSGWMQGGCMPEIRKTLGYRFTLVDVAYSERVRPGGLLVVQVNLRNDGWAAPYNARPGYVSLGALVARVDAWDLRRLGAGAQATYRVTLRVPASLAPGYYPLGLWLPDEASSLRDDPRYAIELGNDAVWDSITGINRLADALPIDPSAPGDYDPNATELGVVP